MYKPLPIKRKKRLLILSIALWCCFNLAFTTSRAASPDLTKKINLDLERKTLKEAFDQIAVKAKIPIIYSDINEVTKKEVTIHVKEKAINQILNDLLPPYELSYQVIDDKIVITHTVVRSDLLKDGSRPSPVNPIKGRITDPNGGALLGATVKLKESSTIVITDQYGDFEISPLRTTGILIISFVGYQTIEVPFNTNTAESLIIILKADANSLNEVQVIGYGTTTKRLNTGSVSTINAKEIGNQPITNVLSALSGRMAGVNVQTTNGLPGGNINIQIRGKGSILAGTDPLYIIDGVPFSSSLVSQYGTIATSSIGGAVSPLNSINPGDIESINILKDADATAIYGSRGTNGVILITTKKGRNGKAKIDINFNQGLTNVTNYPKLLNLQQFLQIRHEAFKNSGATPTTTNAKDLLVWDTTKYTNWAKYYFGRTGHSTNIQGGIFGGNDGTTFNISGNYHGEKTVLPGDNFYCRGGVFANIQHTTKDNKFNISLSTSYTSDNNRIANVVNTVSIGLLLPPDYPLYNADGSYNWYITNPLAESQAQSISKTNNLIGNLSLKYTLFKGLDLKVNAGFNKIENDQTEIFPSVSLYPGSVNYTNFGNNSNQSVIIEPQITYEKAFSNSKLSLLAGVTYQNTNSGEQTIIASAFTNADLMQDAGSAGSVIVNNVYTQYRYVSVFGRITYNYNDKYIFNGTIRRDGSSRFGLGNQFGNFGSVGAAYLFSNEDFIKNSLGFLSFGKLRASYGLTGNDQIPDYQYLSTYGSSAAYNYQNTSALMPTRIANADFHWETTKKLELAMDLGFLKDRILVSIDRYVNKSNDQLVAYSVPYLTGFNSYEANLPAVVENSGWEFTLDTKNIIGNKFKWSTTFNFTAPKNVLKSFKDFASSSYSQTLQLGYDITRIYGYKFLGVDPATGKSSYATEPGNGSIEPYFYNTIGKQTPDFYGGIGNSFSYKSWQLDIFGQFAKQMAKGGITYPPGIRYNTYTTILNRWHNPGDQTNVPRASTSNDIYYAASSANYFDASYFRLKNIAASYSFSPDVLKRLKFNQLRIYLQGENIFTLWNKNSAFLDPESGALTVSSKNIPPMRSFIIGFQITL